MRRPFDALPRTLILVAGMSALGFAARTVHAQASAADTSLARQLGNEGLDLAASGDCTRAVEKLSRAEGLHHAPTTLTVLGECHLTLGHLVEGVEELTRVAREDLPPGAPPAFRKAQARARQKLAVAKARVPKLKIFVDGAPKDEPMEITVDGQAVHVATLGLDRPIDPGDHVIEVSAAGYETTSSHLAIKEGAYDSVRLVLKAVAAPPAAVATAPAQTSTASQPEAAHAAPTETAPAKSRHASYVPAILSFSVGGVGLAVGSVLGVATLSKASHLSSVCQPKNACPGSAQGDIDSASTLALGSTIGMAVGVVGVGLGTYFLLAPPHTDEARASARVTVSPWLGPGSAGVVGTF
jgi:hypothetical protein